MTLNDPIANVFSIILNAERISRTECIIRPVSKIIRKILKILNDNMYIGEIEDISEARGNIVKINLLGNINKCGVIKPNYTIKKKEFEKFEKRYLPAKDFGIIIISTSKGLMTHKEAREKGIGGKLLVYCY